MNGRHFSGMVVEAYIADGTEKFKKTNEKRAKITGLDADADAGNGNGNGNGEGEDEDESKRLDQFGAWLEEKPT